MRKIIYTLPDGGVAVVAPVRNTHPVPEELEDLEIEGRAWERLPKDAINPEFVDDVPADRTFRGAWKADGGSIVCDMEKAIEIHKDMLRELRAPLLEQLDIDYMLALEKGNTAALADIASRKQALRDVTVDASIVNAKTPEELKLAIPDILK